MITPTPNKGERKPRWKADRSKYLKVMVDGKTPRCQGTVRTEGQPDRQCRKQAIMNMPVCGMHGAGTYANPGGGKLNPSARYSALLPRRLATRFDQMVHEPSLLEYRPDIALLMVRIEELLGRLEDNIFSVQQMLPAIRSMERGLAIGDAGMIVEAFKGIKAATKAELDTREIWGEIRELLQERKSLVSAEHGRLMDAQQLMSMDEVFAMLAQVRRAVLEHVTDMNSRVALSQVFSRLADLPSSKGMLH